MNTNTTRTTNTDSNSKTNTNTSNNSNTDTNTNTNTSNCLGGIGSGLSRSFTPERTRRRSVRAGEEEDRCGDTWL